LLRDVFRLYHQKTRNERSSKPLAIYNINHKESPSILRVAFTMSVPPRVAQMRARTGYNSEEESNSAHFPPPHRARTSKKYKSRHRAYSLPREKPASRRSEVNLLLCVYRHSTHEWSTEPLRFDPQRVNDRELWTQIRVIYREDLQKPWRRIVGFKKLRHIVPIVVCPPAEILALSLYRAES